jgi:predicted PurR-regulated permease PerM
MTSLNKNFLWLIGIALLGLVLWYFADIFAYLLIAWVLSMLGKPLMAFFQQKIHLGKYHLGREVAALLTILVFYGVIAGLIMLFVPTIVEQARNLSTVDYQALGEKLRGPFFNLDVQMHKIGVLKPNESLSNKTLDAVSTVFKPTMLSDFVGTFLSIAGNIVVAMTAITFILFFFLKDNNLFVDILHSVVPDELEPKVRHAVDESSNVLTRYFGGILLQTTVFSIMVTTILWISGVPSALLIGSFGGILNVIPYVGPIIGQVLGLFITVSSHINADFALIWPLLLKVIVAFGITQAVDNNFIGPMIFSKSVQAHPLEIFIVTLVAAKLGGIVGMVVGIPVYTVLRVIARTFFSEFKIVQRWTEHLDEEGV